MTLPKPSNLRDNSPAAEAPTSDKELPAAETGFLSPQRVPIHSVFLFL